MLNGTGSVHFADNAAAAQPSRERRARHRLHAGRLPHARSSASCVATGFESDRELHLAHNAGLPLADPTGGFYFVFMTGRPAFRKYSARRESCSSSGTSKAPRSTRCSTRSPRSGRAARVEDREVPFVAPVIRAAAVSPDGELWISLAVPYTYVYDASGRQDPHACSSTAPASIGPDQPVVQPHAAPCSSRPAATSSRALTMPPMLAATR